MEDYEKFNKTIRYEQDTGRLFYKRSGKEAKARSRSGYIVIWHHDRLYQGHRVAWLLSHGAWPKNDIDHINEVKDDNRLVNLRDVDRSTNLHNKAKPNKNSKSAYRGIMYDKHTRSSKKWRARIMKNRKTINLGRFDTEEEAKQAYLSAREGQ
jgi:hypothetical protein